MTERCLFIVIVLALLALPCAAQDRTTPIPALPLGDALLNLPTARIPIEGEWEVRFTHRFIQPVNRGDVHSLWGLDGGADVGIGLSWAARPYLQISLVRSSLLDDIELAARYVFVQQAPSLPFSLSLRGGAAVRTDRGASHRSSLFAQAIVSHQVASRRAEVFFVPTVVTNAGPFRSAVSLPIGAAYALKPTLFVIGEIYPVNRDLPAGLRSDVGWAVGLKRTIGGHYFDVMLSDTRATLVDQYTPGAFICDGRNRCAGIEGGDLHLGFNIVRKFGRRVGSRR
ncbi:MAG TPA: DUF5777 family beta-barrel protein [Thermoanaerobaculia bacterium]|nr:DUF5777 family beta-barrel protein [Thermoanaerobaculia bacterium]